MGDFPEVFELTTGYFSDSTGSSVTSDSPCSSEQASRGAYYISQYLVIPSYDQGEPAVSYK